MTRLVVNTLEDPEVQTRATKAEAFVLAIGVWVLSRSERCL